MKDILLKIWLYFISIICTIVLSIIIAVIIDILSTATIYYLDILIPEIISRSLSFNISDVGSDIIKDNIIPGWGTISSIINNNSFGPRIHLLLLIIIDIVFCLLSFFFAHLLDKVVRKNIFLMLIYILVVLFIIIKNVILVFFTTYYIDLGLQQDVWFYLVSVIILGIQVLLYFLIGVNLYKKY